MLKTKLNIKTIAVVSLLIAVQIVLSRFLSVSLWNLKFGFAFIPVMLAARKFGPVEAMLVGGVGDLVGAILFPIGTYFPGFTATAVLVGLTYGLLLHKKCTLMRIVSAVLLSELVGSLLLNTLWISILYSSPFTGLFVTRIVQVVVMAIIEIIIGYFMFVVYGKIIEKI